MKTHHYGRRCGAFLSRIALAAATGIALSGIVGCQSDSHADSSGNFGAGGTTSEGKAPDCYKGTGRGRGRFKGYAKFAPDAPAAPSSNAFDILLGGEAPSGATGPAADPDLFLGWGGGGGGGHDKEPC